jgi:hypothetical protein
MVGASRFGGQVPLEGAQSKGHIISRSHPVYSDGFTGDLAAHFLGGMTAPPQELGP